MRFVATADWQLGMTRRWLSTEHRPRFAQARLDVIRTIGDLAAARDAEFILVCGDVFESNQLDRAVIARTFEALRDVTVPVYLLPGNHDPLDAASLYRSREFVNGCPDHVHVLDAAGVHEVSPGVEIVAAPWTSKRPLSDLVADALAGLEPAAGVLRVVAGHGSTWSADAASPSAIRVDDLTAAFEAGVAHVAVLGDRHSTTRTTDRIWYPGAPEVTDRREIDPGNVLVIDVDAADVAVETVHVGRWAFVKHAASLDSLVDVGELRGWLEARPAKDRTGVWLQLEGTLSITAKAALDDLLDDMGLLFAVIELWDRHSDVVVLPADGEFDDLGLTGFASAAVTELKSRVAADDEAARDALGLLYRLTRSGA